MDQRAPTSKISPQSFSKNWNILVPLILTLVVIAAGVFIGLPHRQQAYAAAGGIWPTYMDDKGRSGYNAAETMINPTSAPNLKLHWSYQTSGYITTQPVESNGMVYWGSWDGYEYATKPDGTFVWKHNLGQTTDTNCKPPTVGVASTATVASVTINGQLTPVFFVGGGLADLYALNAATGAVIWRTQLGTSPEYFTWSSPAYYKGSIYIGMSSFGDCPLVRGKLMKLNAVTGAIQQVFYTAPKQCKTAGVWGSPTIDPSDGSVYITTGNGACGTTPLPYAFAIVKLRLSDLTPLGSWQVPAGNRAPGGDWGTTPTLFQATVSGATHYLVGAANKNGVYYAFDRTNINQGPVWTARIAVSGGCPECGQGSISSSAWDGTTLYVAGGNTTINGTSCQGSLQALDPATGAAHWQDCLSNGPVLGAVSAVPGVVVVGEGNHLVVVAAATGKTLFTYVANMTFWGSASISLGTLYIGNQNGLLYAFGP